MKDERDAAVAAHRRVVANESNHYDRYWTPAAEPLTDEWLDVTEAKMGEALTDVFCDDAAAVMLTLITEIRRLRCVTAQDREPHTTTEEATMITIDGRCFCARCEESAQDIYRMVGYCLNCGTGDILVIYRAGDPTHDQDCPVCGNNYAVRSTSQRLATPDEVPVA